MKRRAGNDHYARQRRRCRNGHPYTDANTKWRLSKKWNKERGEWAWYRVRFCARCRNVRSKLWLRKARAAERGLLSAAGNKSAAR